MAEKSVCTVFLLAVILLGCVIVDNVSFTKASTPLNGLIKTDTTWTKANSPYELTGPVGVISGVTLTIEPGTVVDLKNHGLLINGTIVARGTAAAPITLDGEALSLTSVSTSWDEKTGQGSIIEHAIVTKIYCHSSPKITDSRIWYLEIGGGAPLIENNVFTERLQITDNSSALIFGNTIENTVGVGIDSGKVELVNNQMPKGISLCGPLGRADGIAIVANNTIGAYSDENGNAIIVSHIHAEIEGNNINGNIVVYSGGQIIGDGPASATISNNVISGAINHSGFSGSIQNNLIRDVRTGCAISISNGATIVSNNTITNCDTCIFVSGDVEKAPTIAYNNFIGYKTNSIEWINSKDCDAKNNWWGTTDTSAISQSIYDNKNNYNLGTVNFTPFLSQANPKATPYIDVNSASSTPTSTLSTQATTNNPQSQTQSETYFLEIVIFAVVIVIAVLVAGIFLVKRKSQNRIDMPV